MTARSGSKTTFTVHYDSECDWVTGRLTGAVDSIAIEEYADEVLRVASKSGCKCLLSDLQGAEVSLSIADLYGLPEILRAKGIDQGWLRAFIVSDRQRDGSFYETVAANRGHTVKMFTDPDQAMDWIRQHRSP